MKSNPKFVFLALALAASSVFALAAPEPAKASSEPTVSFQDAAALAGIAQAKPASDALLTLGAVGAASATFEEAAKPALGAPVVASTADSALDRPDATPVWALIAFCVLPLLGAAGLLHYQRKSTKV